MVYQLAPPLQAIVDRTPEEFIHPKRVASHAESEDEFVVAMFHDAIEDHVCSASDLVDAGITEHQLESILNVTRDYQKPANDPKEPYESYIQRLTAIGTRTALAVKVYDIFDHLRPAHSDSSSYKRVMKYTSALRQVNLALLKRSKEAGIRGPAR